MTAHNYPSMLRWAITLRDQYEVVPWCLVHVCVSTGWKPCLARSRETAKEGGLWVEEDKWNVTTWALTVLHNMFQVPSSERLYWKWMMLSIAVSIKHVLYSPLCLHYGFLTISSSKLNVKTLKIYNLKWDWCLRGIITLFRKWLFILNSHLHV